MALLQCGSAITNVRAANLEWQRGPDWDSVLTIRSVDKRCAAIDPRWQIASSVPLGSLDGPHGLIQAATLTEQARRSGVDASWLKVGALSRLSGPEWPAQWNGLCYAVVPPQRGAL